MNALCNEYSHLNSFIKEIYAIKTDQGITYYAIVHVKRIKIACTFLFPLGVRNLITLAHVEYAVCFLDFSSAVDQHLTLWKSST